MAKRNSGSSPVSGTARSGSAKKRPPLTQVKKPFPWGTVIGGGAVLALALIGIVAYAATNQGSGFTDPIEAADEKFPGLSVTEDLPRDHVEGAVDYPSVPPVGGPHNGVPQQCDVYTEQVPTENVVHSLEHGAVWITYRPDLPQDQVDKLTDIVDGDPYGLLSPLPGQDAPIMATAWGRQLPVDNADDERIEEFLETYASGPQSPELGAACAGSTSTGTLGQPLPQPTPPLSPAPSAPAASTEPSPAG
jgi:hypothetical protein